jgi:hypothetical protein
MVSLTTALSTVTVGLLSGALYGAYDTWSTLSKRSDGADLSGSRPFNTHILAPQGSVMSGAVLSNPAPPGGGFSRCVSQSELCDGSVCRPYSEEYGLKTSFGPEDHGSVHSFGLVVPTEGGEKPVEHFVSDSMTIVPIFDGERRGRRS